MLGNQQPQPGEGAGDAVGQELTNEALALLWVQADRAFPFTRLMRGDQHAGGFGVCAVEFFFEGRIH